MIGVGGIGMSALARLFVHEKKEVSGSDRAASPITCGLEALGVTFFDTQVKENITPDIGLVVYTEAMSKDQEEMIAAEALGVPMMNYFEALALVANQYYLIAVSGTHGKTTTTAMLIDIFEEAGLDPSAIVGSLRAKTGSNFRPGKSKYMIVEACEYRRDFLHLEPDVLVITNIEAEHLDYYTDLADVQSAFKEFVHKVREGGAVIANLSDDKVRPCTEGVGVTVIDYSKYVDPLLKLKIPGMHNQMNAAVAKAAAKFVGVKDDTAKQALEAFAGTWRRFEYKGEVNGAPVYDDYGHHPTEIMVTLKGARELYPDKKIFLVYQPHLDSRTEKLFDDFIIALSGADRLILNPAYAARAVGGSHDSTKRLAEAIKEKETAVEYIESFDEIVALVQKEASPQHLVLVMGAGDISKVAESLTK
jgi:UDP-N-acetylmuramate--alanine ligase